MSGPDLEEMKTVERSRTLKEVCLRFRVKEDAPRESTLLSYKESSDSAHTEYKWKTPVNDLGDSGRYTISRSSTSWYTTMLRHITIHETLSGQGGRRHTLSPVTTQTGSLGVVE